MATKVYTGAITVDSIVAGDAGTEGGGITIGGLTFESVLKASDLGGSNAAMAILHRHSTTLGSILIGSRSNSNTSSHSIVVDGQDLLSIYGAGYDGADYAIGARILMEVDGTPGAGDMPTSIDFQVAPDGSETPASAMKIRADKALELTGNIGFYGTTPVAQQTGVAVSDAAVHAALVNLGLITA